MTDFGIIRTYDTANGTGTVSRDIGGADLPFRKSALVQPDEVPRQGQRYSYDVKSNEAGEPYAANLHLQDEDGTEPPPRRRETLQEQAAKQRG